MLPVTVIIVTHNSAEVILPCLRSVQNATRIIIVDNDSTDTTCLLAKQHFPRVECIENKKNVGFGNANNQALEIVTTPFALLLNPDAVMNENALATLLSAAEQYPDAAILSPQLLAEDNTPQQSYKRVIFEREKLKNALDVPTDGDVCADFLSGAVMLLRMEHFATVGFFDAKIFLYYEDDDLCIRARKAGFGLVWVQKATAIHLCGKSSPSSLSTLYYKNWHMAWSRIYLERKYQGDMAALVLKAEYIVRYWLKTIGYCLVGNKEKAFRSLARMAAAIGR